MKVKVIGEYGRYAPAEKATSCYLLMTDSGKNIVIDLGAGSVSGLQKYIDLTDIDCVIITHLHFDHCSDLGVLSYALAYLGAKKIKVYMPAESAAMREVFAAKNFDISVIEDDFHFCVDNINFTFVKSPHPVETYAVKIEANGKKLVYTSDCSRDIALKNNVAGADIVIGDACILDADHNQNLPHVSVKQLAKSVPQHCMLYLAHLTAGDEDKILQEAEKYHNKCAIVKDFEF